MKVVEKLYLSYALPTPEEWAANLRLFHELVAEFANKFLERVWDEEIIDEIHEYSLSGKNGEYTKPAYKFFEEKSLAPDDEEWKELPSRFRRGIMESVGRVLRSQKERKDCFYDVLPLFLKYYGDRGNEERRKKKAFKKIRGELIANEKYYNYILLRQVVYQIANYYEKNGVLPEKYVECVKPSLSGTFPFDVDDGRIGFGKISEGDKGKLFQLCYRVKDKELKLHLRVKLPVKDGEKIRWEWFEEDLDTHPKFKEMLASHKMGKPTLVRRRLKSGFFQYQLIFPFEVKGAKKTGKHILCIDLGERKVVSAVVMDYNGNQLSPPIFVRVLPSIKEKIQRIRAEISNIQSKIRRSCSKVSHLSAELKKKWNKMNNLFKQLTHELSNTIIRIAQAFNCNFIVFEDLKSYQPPKGRNLLSWLLSMWRRGDIITTTRYKALRRGLRVETVRAFNTSKVCPRCNSKGEHVKAPDRLDEKGEAYSIFHCPSCCYTADRDYVGALNVGRRFILDESGEKKAKLEDAKATVYKTEVGSPADCSRRGTQRATTHLLEIGMKLISLSPG